MEFLYERRGGKGLYTARQGDFVTCPSQRGGRSVAGTDEEGGKRATRKNNPETCIEPTREI